MRKINLSNDTKRDAEVAFGTTFHRSTPVYKTADGKKSVNERRVRATMKTTDEALLAQYGEGLADARSAEGRLLPEGRKNVQRSMFNFPSLRARVATSSP